MAEIHRLIRADNPSVGESGDGFPLPAADPELETRKVGWRVWADRGGRRWCRRPGRTLHVRAQPAGRVGVSPVPEPVIGGRHAPPHSAHQVRRRRRGVATTATTAVVLATVTAGPAAACGAPIPSTRPISADAPYDSPFTNSGSLRLPAVAARAGTDYGHLPRWKHFADGRVLLREDRVTLRRSPDPGFIRYTNVNPRLRSYWLDRDVVIRVGIENYQRMTGHYPGTGSGAEPGQPAAVPGQLPHRQQRRAGVEVPGRLPAHLRRIPHAPAGDRGTAQLLRLLTIAGPRGRTGLPFNARKCPNGRPRGRSNPVSGRRPSPPATTRAATAATAETG